MLFISAVLFTSTPLILSIISPVLIPQSLAGEQTPSAVITSQMPITSTVVVFNVNPAGNPPRYNELVSALAVSGVEKVKSSTANINNNVLKNFYLKSITVLCVRRFLIYKKTAAKKAAVFFIS